MSHKKCYEKRQVLLDEIAGLRALVAARDTRILELEAALRKAGREISEG